MSRTYSIVTYERYTGQTGKRFRKQIAERPPSDPEREAFKDAQYLADVLIANPHANMYGLYYITLSTMQELTGLTVPELRRALQLLRDDGFCAWDDETDMLWVREMARIQMFLPLSAGNKLVKPTNEWYRRLKRNPYLGPFYDRYVSDLRLEARRDEMRERMPTLPLEPAPPTGVPERRAVDRADGPSLAHQLFLVFLEAYPPARRVGGPSGLAAFMRALRTREDPEAHVQMMLDALDFQCRSEQWRQGVIPGMVKWLDEEQWLRDMPRPRTVRAIAGPGMGCEHGCANAGEHAIRVELDKFCRHEPRCNTFLDHYVKENA